VGDTTQAGPMLASPYPSPAVGTVHLAFVLPREARVELTILDVRGRRVRTIVPSGAEPAGAYAKEWNGRDDSGRSVAPGLYIVRLRVDGKSFERRVPMIR